MADINFEDIQPFVEGQGDTGKTAREKINRNFQKLKGFCDDSEKNISGLNAKTDSILKTLDNPTVETSKYQYDLYLTAGKTYYFKHISGDIGAICVGSSSTPLINNEWVAFTPNTSGYAYIYKSVKVETPVVLFTSSIATSLSESSKENVSNKVATLDIESTDTQYPTAKTVYDFIGKLANGEDIWSKKCVLSLVYGSNHYSRVDLYQGETIAAGTILKFRIKNAFGILTQFSICNDAWHIIAQNVVVENSNEQDLIVTLPENCTSFGLYVSSDYIEASGNVEVSYIIGYEKTVSQKLENVEKALGDATKSVAEISDKVNAKVDAKPGKNIFNNTSYTEGYYLWHQAGKERIIEQRSYGYSDYIAVEPNTSYKPNTSCQSTDVHFYDSERNFIGYYTLSSDVAFTTPDGCRFIRTSFELSKLNSFQIEVGEETTSYEAYSPISGYNLQLDEETKKRIENSAYFDFSNVRFVNVPNLISAVKSVRLWGVAQGYTYGLSYLSRKSNVGYQIFLNIFDSEGNRSGIFGKLSFTEENQDGATYGVIYRDDFTFYQAYHSDRNIIPSEVRILIDYSKIEYGGFVGSYKPTVSFLPISEKVCNNYPNPYTLLNDSGGGVEHIYITCSRDGMSGVDADFCGLHAVGDALTSISDASANKQYHLMIKGHFLYTNPKLVDDGGDFKYLEGDEPTPFWAKPYCSLEGIDYGQAILEVNLADGLDSGENGDFPYSEALGRYLDYTDYNPIYIRTSCLIRNLTIIGKNCRYSFHIETGRKDLSPNIDIQDCILIRRQDTKGYHSVMTIGELPHFNLRMTNCRFVNENKASLFGGHTPLHPITDGRDNCKIDFINCDFATAGTIGMSTHEYNRKDLFNFINCKFASGISMSVSANSTSVRSLGTLVKIKSSSSALPFYCNPEHATALRIRAMAGESSSVRFDNECSAFGIVSDVDNEGETPTERSTIITHGYEYKDDANGSNAWACGWRNVDATTGISMGIILGDCSSESKTLTVVINGTSYDVVFDTDLTNTENSDILNIINDVIEGVAVAELYNPEYEEFPEFGDMEYYITNGDNELIERGMGVVKTGLTTIRRAKSTDGYIDGISVDDIYPSQAGRIIKKGVLYWASEYYSTTRRRFAAKHTDATSIGFGSKISIDANNDGVFVVSDSSPVLKALSSDTVEIL